MIITITGHRKISFDAKIKIDETMQYLLSHCEVDKIFFGGAKGTDTYALECALKHRQNKNCQLIVIVPDVLEKQPFETQSISQQADEIIELYNEITPKNRYLSYKLRNEYMIDNCHIVVAFFDGNYKSGTGHAISYAKQTNKETMIVTI